GAAARMDGHRLAPARAAVRARRMIDVLAVVPHDVGDAVRAHGDPAAIVVQVLREAGPFPRAPAVVTGADAELVALGPLAGGAMAVEIEAREVDRSVRRPGERGVGIADDALGPGVDRQPLPLRAAVAAQPDTRLDLQFAVVVAPVAGDEELAPGRDQQRGLAA